MKNIVLTGMMGCGKTTIARLLGDTLHRHVVDTDDLVEKQGGMSISQMFALHGETYMRDVETQVCQRLSQTENLIIATGGGLPLRPQNRDYLKSNGLVFFLARDPEIIYNTIDPSARPLAQQGKDAFLQRFYQREPIYREFAHVVISDFSSPRNTLTEILSKLEMSI